MAIILGPEAGRHLSRGGPAVGLRHVGHRLRPLRALAAAVRAFGEELNPLRISKKSIEIH